MINRKKGFSLAALTQAKDDAAGNGSSTMSSIFDWSKRKEGTPTFFAVKEGTNRLNFVPYEVKTALHPGAFEGRFQLGTDEAQDFVFAVDIHSFIGPLKATVLCPKQFGKPCPICEANQQAYKAGNKDEAVALRAKKRVYYNVEDKNDPGKIKVFDVSSNLFQKEMMEEATASAEGGGIVDFVSPDTGKTVRFRAAKTTKGDMTFFEYKSFAFEDRSPISDELLAQAISFDEYAKLYSYDEILEIMQGHIPGSLSVGNTTQAAPVQAPVQQAVAPQPVQVVQPVQQVAPPVQPAQVQTFAQQLAEQVAQGSVAPQPVQAPVQAAPVQQAVAPVAGAIGPNGGVVLNGFEYPKGCNPGIDTDSKPECDTCPFWDKCIDAVKK